ncbi:MAG TPA: T3SS effector HopA1 family protein [Nitrososphaeraceae archaeon]|nr:T3SS effector HopA1 family protein [Nitrososphaeraceae archaeon]
MPQNQISYVKEIELLLKNIKIKSDTSFVFNDRIYETSKTTEENLHQSNKNLKNNLITHLGNYLYQLIHCRQTFFDDQMSTYRNNFYDGNRDENFIELLSKANTGIGTWEPGWIVHKMEKNGKIAIKKNDLIIWVMPYQFATQNSKQICVGDKGYAAMVKEYRELLPGFYMANGNISMNYESLVVRIYWNITSDGAVSLVKYLTTELNNKNIPFQFKILKDENLYTRADAGVLYIDKNDVKKASKSLSVIYDNIKSFLKPSVPLFAKKLASGISLAEDPSNSESFGQNRCRIFAESIYDIYIKNVFASEEKFKQVEKYFKTQYVDFNKPYLKNMDSKDDYESLHAVFGK